MLLIYRLTHEKNNKIIKPTARENNFTIILIMKLAELYRLSHANI